MATCPNLRLIALSSVIALAAVVPLAAATATSPSAPPESLCGPLVGAPTGVRARTCTLTQEGDTWARTQILNPTGRPLAGRLTLMRPDGRTVQIDCRAEAEKNRCETPHEPTVSRADPYAAVAELAYEDGESGLVLRSGSSGAGN